ncbi:MAG: DUF3604 domain-containing protein, partial [Lentisphaerae bacterium]|nr:DUF3604 domain-containing protein [Lentisphaerota bacterium]
MLKIRKSQRARITDKHPRRWVLEWTPPQDYNGPLEVELRCVRLRSVIKWQWIDFTFHGRKVKKLWQISPKPSYHEIIEHNRSQALVRFRLPAGIKKKNRCQFKLMVKPPPICGLDAPIVLLLFKDAETIATDGPVILTASAGRAAGLSVTSRAAPEDDGTLRVVVAPIDRFGYPAQFAHPVSVRLRAAKATVWKGSVRGARTLFLKLPKNGTMRLRARIDPKQLRRNEQLRNAELAAGELQVVSNPVWWPAPQGLRPLFGEIHWHTDLSDDGIRSLEAAFLAARDFLNLDFAAPSDHTPVGVKWLSTVQVCDRFNATDCFTTIYGFEHSSSRGHVNFYFTNPDHPLQPDTAPKCPQPATYMDNLPFKEFIAIPHHSNAVSDAVKADGTPFWRQYPWGRPRAYLCLVEIFQIRGNFEQESPPPGWRTVQRNNGSSVQTALNKGHKLGFVGGTDNHCGWPVILSELATAKRFPEDEVPLPSRIYTGVW